MSQVEPNYNISTYTYYQTSEEVKTQLKKMLEQALESIEQDDMQGVVQDLEYDVTSIHELFKRLDLLYYSERTKKRSRKTVE